MIILFYIAVIIAILASLMVITRKNAVHALLYLIVSLLAVAVIFYLLGAPFIAALEIIIYAGAIMVLFIFVVMMLNLGPESINQEKEWLSGGIWIGPGILTALLLIEFIMIFSSGPAHAQAVSMVSPKQVGISLFSKYLLGVEMAAMLLMSAIIGAFHLGQRKKKVHHRFLQENN
ncbi:MAG: NADH-quinone oxidoreductase subunit J [Calditrichaceae bacterium]|jgi:NADH-quinone oxidoreductase subunit J